MNVHLASLILLLIVCVFSLCMKIKMARERRAWRAEDRKEREIRCRIQAVAEKRMEAITSGKPYGPETLTYDNLAESEAFFEERKPTP